MKTKVTSILIIVMLILSMLSCITYAYTESWDDFYVRFGKAMSSDGKRSDLSTEDLDRMIKGPTQQEILNSKYPIDPALLKQLQNKAKEWKLTDHQAGIVDSNNGSNIKDTANNTSNQDRTKKANELKKEITNFMAGDISKKSTEDIRKYVNKINEYKIYVGTRLDETMTSYYARLNSELEKRGQQKDDTIFQGEIDSDGTVTDSDKPSTGQLGSADASATHTPDEIVSEAQGFINKGSSGQSTVNGANLKAGSNTLYNILLTIGIITAVLVGVYLGAKFIMASAEDKAKVKESLIPYFAGCIVIFGAFIIWRLAINLLSTIDKTAKMEYNIEYRIAKSIQNDVDFNIFS